MRRTGTWRPRIPGAVRLGILVFLLQACGGGRTADNPFQRAESEEKVVLRVENRNSSDARIFLRPMGRRVLLSTIEARDLRYLEFSWPSRMPLDLELELIVGERYRPPPLPMTPGIRVELIIESPLRRSTLRQ